MDVLLTGVGFAVSSLYAALWGYRFINLIGERLIRVDNIPERVAYIKDFEIVDEDDNLESDSESEDEDDDVLVVG